MQFAGLPRFHRTVTLRLAPGVCACGTIRCKPLQNLVFRSAEKLYKITTPRSCKRSGDFYFPSPACFPLALSQFSQRAATRPCENWSAAPDCGALLLLRTSSRPCKRQTAAPAPPRLFLPQAAPRLRSQPQLPVSSAGRAPVCLPRWGSGYRARFLFPTSPNQKTSAAQLKYTTKISAPAVSRSGDPVFMKLSHVLEHSAPSQTMDWFHKTSDSPGRSPGTS